MVLNTGPPASEWVWSYMRGCGLTGGGVDSHEGVWTHMRVCGLMIRQGFQ